MSKTVIIGAGLAGIMAAYFKSNAGELDNVIVLDKNPLGQLQGEFILGPRVLKLDFKLKMFLDAINMPYDIVDNVVGYLDEHLFETTLNDEFKKKYSLITRGTEVVEKSFLSSGEDVFKVADNNNGTLYYDIVKYMYDKIKHLIIHENLFIIDTKNKIVNNKYKYDEVISTIHLKQLLYLLNCEHAYDIKIANKNFVIAEYDSLFDIAYKEKYAYMYSINKLFSRKTYQKKYICYETNEPFYGKEIDSNRVIKTFNNLPVQICKSLNLEEIRGIKLLGRYAQINHSIKINELLNKLYV